MVKARKRVNPFLSAVRIPTEKWENRLKPFPTLVQGPRILHPFGGYPREHRGIRDPLRGTLLKRHSAFPFLKGVQPTVSFIGFKKPQSSHHDKQRFPHASKFSRKQPKTIERQSEMVCFGYQPIATPCSSSRPKPRGSLRRFRISKFGAVHFYPGSCT